MVKKGATANTPLAKLGAKSCERAPIAGKVAVKVDFGEIRSCTYNIN